MRSLHSCFGYTITSTMDVGWDLTKLWHSSLKLLCTKHTETTKREQRSYTFKILKKYEVYICLSDTGIRVIEWHGYKSYKSYSRPPGRKYTRLATPERKHQKHRFSLSHLKVQSVS